MERKTGVRPGQIVDWLSLVGDAVDNIKGVPGIGPKNCCPIIAETWFQLGRDLHERLKERGQARGAVKAALEGAKEAVFMNRRLIRLRTRRWEGGIFCARDFRAASVDFQTLR